LQPDTDAEYGTTEQLTATSTSLVAVMASFNTLGEVNFR